MIINIKGQDIKFGYGLYFLGKAQKSFNTDLGGLLSGVVKNPLSDIVDLMYLSAKTEAELDSSELKITKRDFVEFLESNNDFSKEDGYLSKWSNLFIETIKGNFLPEIKSDNEGDVEKKN